MSGRPDQGLLYRTLHEKLRSAATVQPGLFVRRVVMTPRSGRRRAIQIRAGPRCFCDLGNRALRGTRCNALMVFPGGFETLP